MYNEINIFIYNIYYCILHNSLCGTDYKITCNADILWLLLH